MSVLFSCCVMLIIASKDMFEYKTRNKLHCTSKFYGRTRTADEYVKNPAVAQSIGRAFQLYVYGFTITARSLGNIAFSFLSRNTDLVLT